MFVDYKWNYGPQKKKIVDFIIAIFLGIDNKENFLYNRFVLNKQDYRPPSREATGEESPDIQSIN